VLTEQDSDDHTILVDRTVEVAFLPFAEQEYLVHDPAPADRTSSTSDLGSQLRPDGLDPVEHGPMRDDDAAFGQQLEDLTAGQRVRQVPGHGCQG
jgi:hypothetical protein